MENQEYLQTKEFKKFKLVYCGELLLFAIIFTVIGVLFLTGVIAIKPWKFWVFPILTLCGGIWFIIDLIWMMKSKKRQMKNSLIDKILPLPCALAVMGFDIYFLINNVAHMNEEGYIAFFRLVIGIVLCYYAVVYFFEAFFHYYKPSKALTYAFEDALRQEAEQAAKEAEKSALEEIKEECAPEENETKE